MRDTRLLYALLVPAALLVLLFVSLNFKAAGGVATFASGILLSLVIGSGLGAVFYLRKGLSAPTLQASIHAERSGHELRQTLAVRLTSRNRILRRIARKRSESLKSLVLRSGLTLSPYSLACDYVFSSLVIFIVMLPVSVSLSLLVSRNFLLVLLVPPFIIFVPDLMLRASARERARALEAELPYFASFALAMDGEGLPVYDSLMTATGKGVLVQTEKEGLIASRNSAFFGNDSTSALEGVGRLHPSEGLADLFLGYTSVLRLGADTGRYLREKTSGFLLNMREGYRRRDVTALLVVLSLSALWGCLVLAGIYSTAEWSAVASGQLDLFGLFALLAISGLAYVKVSEPGHAPTASPSGSLRASALSFIVTLILFSAQKEAVLAVAGGALSFLAAYGMSVRLRITESEMTTAGLPAFVRDVTEHVKSGAEISEAVILTADSRSYGPPLDAYLRDVSMELQMGRRLSDISTRVRSWLGNFTFFFLGQASEYGAGPTALEDLHEAVASAVRAEREISWARGLATAASFVAPALFVLALFSLTGSRFQLSLDSPASGTLGSVFAIILLGSTSLAVVTSRAVDRSSRNFLWVVLVIGEIVLLYAIGASIS